MLFLELWIFSDIWIQNYFFKRISKNVALDICWSFEIYICQKTILRSDLKITSIFSKRYVGKKPFFQRDLTKSTFSSDIDIFGEMGNKRLFKVISKKLSLGGIEKLGRGALKYES